MVATKKNDVISEELDVADAVKPFVDTEITPFAKTALDLIKTQNKDLENKIARLQAELASLQNTKDGLVASMIQNQFGKYCVKVNFDRKKVETGYAKIEKEVKELAKTGNIELS